MDRPDFQWVVEENWGQPSPLPEALDSFQNTLADWNKTMFGNIFTNKKRILRRLDGVQRSLASTPTPGLLKLEARPREELNAVLQHEESFGCKNLEVIGSGWVIEILDISILLNLFEGEETKLSRCKMNMGSG